MVKQYESEFTDWIRKEKLAIELTKVVGELWLDRSIELIIFRRKIFDNSVSEILNDHLYAQRYTDLPLTIDVSVSLAKAIASLEMPPARLDLGRLGAEWVKEGSQYANEVEFIKAKLTGIVDNTEFSLKPKDVVLYGFGRIGRLAARVLIAEAGKGEQLRLRAIVTRENSGEDILKRASLLRKDSVHGKMHGTIVDDLENESLIINGQVVKMIYSNAPGSVDFTKYGIEDALLIDNTGVWRDRAGLEKHLLSPGISQVLLTAPGKGDIPNIVYGVNNEKFNPGDDKIYSAASCTTNAITPVLKVIEDKLGIIKGHIETVHSYTNDQNLLDNYHKKYRRGKSAAMNMVITETGAASAIKKVLPNLTQDMTGNAVRVPTPNVSLAILNLQLKSTATKEEVNEILRQASMQGELCEQIDYSISNELVSTDIIGNPHATVIDAPATLGSQDGKSVVLYAWYDNEFGYTRQVIRLAKYLCNVIRLRYY
ncbi:glyceraldehyde-3-phosphate dehydrogenase [soil metagenome]